MSNGNSKHTYILFIRKLRFCVILFSVANRKKYQRKNPLITKTKKPSGEFVWRFALLNNYSAIKLFAFFLCEALISTQSYACNRMETNQISCLSCARHWNKTWTSYKQNTIEELRILNECFAFAQRNEYVYFALILRAIVKKKFSKRLLYFTLNSFFEGRTFFRFILTSPRRRKWIESIWCSTMKISFAMYVFEFCFSFTF